MLTLHIKSAAKYFVATSNAASTDFTSWILCTDQRNPQVCGCSRLRQRHHEDCALISCLTHSARWKKNQPSTKHTNQSNTSIDMTPLKRRLLMATDSLFGLWSLRLWHRLSHLSPAIRDYIALWHWCFLTIFYDNCSFKIDCKATDKRQRDLKVGWSKVNVTWSHNFLAAKVSQVGNGWLHNLRHVTLCKIVFLVTSKHYLTQSLGAY